MRRLLVTAAVAWAAISTVQAASVPADGERHKLVYKGDTFKIKRTGDQIAVERMRKVFRNNNGPAVRLLMKEVAREVSGCDLKDEYFPFYTFTLEATLACPKTEGQS